MVWDRIGVDLDRHLFHRVILFLEPFDAYTINCLIGTIEFEYVLNMNHWRWADHNRIEFTCVFNANLFLDQMLEDGSRGGDKWSMCMCNLGDHGSSNSGSNQGSVSNVCHDLIDASAD